MRRRSTIVLGAAATPAVAAAAQGATYALRAAAARREGRSLEPGVPTPAPTTGLAAAVAADSLVTMPMALLSSLGSPRHHAEADAELDAAVVFYDAAGWLADPAGRHPTPATAPDGTVTAGDGGEVLRFSSGFEPVGGEPGGDRWRSFTANAEVPVRLLRHPGAPRPWLVAVHGQGMGRPSDVWMLRMRRVHEQLGLNVALPVLPLHGPRAAGFAPDQLFVANTFLVNNVLGLSQGVWDLRRLLRLLREDQAAPAVGVLGLSLGSYAASLLSTVEPDLACVVAVVPTADLAGALRAAEPLGSARKARHRALHDERSTRLHHVVSPVARPCLVPHDRRFIVAGQADRIAPPPDAARLWEHWDRPSIDWRPRGHVTTPMSAHYDRHLESILTTSGLVHEHREGP